MRIKPGCRHKKTGFTLLELMIACAITIVGLTGVLASFVTCSGLIETTKNTNFALNAEQKVLEQMRRADFLSLYTSYNGYTFNLSNMAAGNSLGRVTVSNSNPKRLQVDVGVCWKQGANRIIGECTSNGTTLVFSDANANGILDSPAQITTYMAQR